VRVAAVNGRVYNVGTPITLPSGAILTVNPDGSFTYTPAADFAGQDHFTFTVGENGDFATGTATIDVNGSTLQINNVTLTAIAGQTLAVTAGGGLLAYTNSTSGTALAVIAVDGSSSNVGVPITLASGAVLTVNPDGSLTYIPAAGSTDGDHFTFTVSDGVTSAFATATINVAVPTPEFVNLTYLNSPLGTLDVNASNGILANLSNPSGNPLAVTAVNGNPAIIGAPLILASGAILTVNADGSFTYVPAAAAPVYLGFAPLQIDNGDSFTITVSNGTDTTTVRVTIGVSFPSLDALELEC